MIREKNRLDRTILFGLIFLEALLFSSFYMREVAWYPPDNFDQASYLIETYRLQERVFAHGLSQFWKAFSSHGHAAGVLFPIEGALAGIIIGGTRLPQLGVLFVGFCGLQIATFTTARAVWQRRAFGYIALGLVLSELTLWYWEGGSVFDFRIDFLAYCLYGVWACTVLRAQVFLHRYWSLGCGLAGTFLVLNRFVTIAYLLGVSAGLALFCGIVVAISWRRDRDLVSRMQQRLLNLGLSTALLITATGPILLHNWSAIEGYYVINHAVGEEKYVRAALLGIKDLQGHLSFYPNSIVQDHLGRIFLWASAITIGCGLATRLLRRKVREEPVTQFDETFFLQIVFLVGAIAGPLVVLTADISKSAVVGGIVGAPTALLVVAVTASVVGFKARQRESLLVHRILAGCAVGVFAFGLYNQLSQASRHWPAYAHRDDLKQLDELDKALDSLANEYGWTHPRVSYDVITGWLNAGPPTISAFEQSRQMIEFQPMLGNGVLGVNREQALSLLKQSDFAVFTTLPKKGIYPFYQRIAEYWNELKDWADDHMVVVRVIPFSSFTATLYIRPTARISGLSDGWITSHGLSLQAQRSVLERFPIIRLTGPADYSRLKRLPSVDTTLETGKTPQEVPTSFQRAGSNYEIAINTLSLRLPPEDNVYLRLNFDSFFVPKTIETGNDVRELVVKAPVLVQLIRQ